MGHQFSKAVHCALVDEHQRQFDESEDSAQPQKVEERKKLSSSSSMALAHIKVEKIADEIDKLAITMKTTTSITEFLDVIVKNHILAVPVFEKSKCIGFFGIEEFVLHLGYHWKEKRFRLQHHSPFPLKGPLEFDLGSILGAIHRNHSSCLRLFPEDYTSEAITLFAAGAQRIAIFNTHLTSKNLISKVLSQSALLKYAHSHPSSLGEVADQPAAEIGTPWSRALKVRADAPLICAVFLFAEKLGWPITVVGEIDNEEELLAPKSTLHVSKRFQSIESHHCLRHRAEEDEEDERNRLEILEQVKSRRKARFESEGLGCQTLDTETRLVI